jgi:uncharacterized phage protein gp47/JayE
MSEGLIVTPYDELVRLASVERKVRNAALTADEPGTSNNAMGAVGASLTVEAQYAATKAFRNRFVATADGDNVEAAVTDILPTLTRNDATPAIVTLTLTRTTHVGGHTVTAGDEASGTAADGEAVVFTVDETLVIDAADDEVEVDCTAVDAGRRGNVDAGTLDTLQNLPDGWTVTQSERASGGAAAESADAYRARFYASWASLRRGTVEALETGAKNVPGVTYASVDETKRRWADGGYVSVYVGDADAAGNDALADLVAVELENWSSAGIEVRVSAAARDERTFAATVKVKAGQNLALLRAELHDALDAYEDGIAPSKIAYMSGAETDLQNVRRSVILAVDVTAPASREVTPATGQAIRFPRATRTFTFVEV